MSSRPEQDHIKYSGKPKHVHFEDYHTPPRSRPATPVKSQLPNQGEKRDWAADETNLKGHPQDSSSTQPQEPAFAYPRYDSTEPVLTAGQQVFTHHIGGLPPPSYEAYPDPAGHQQPFFLHSQGYFPAATGSQFASYQPSTAVAAPGMSYYPISKPANTGVNFQPQVPDTSLGPELHYYVPRHDGTGVMQPGMMPGGPGFPQMPVMTGGQAMPLHQIPLAGAPLPPVIMQPPMVQPMMGVPAGAPVMGQPVFVQGAPPVMTGNPASMMPMPMPMQPGVHPEPALGVGLTAGEVAVLNEQIAYDNKVDEPQDFLPSDPDPSRMYKVRELDGQWTLRNRFTIENLGDCRWYITDDGVFYAIRIQK